MVVGPAPAVALAGLDCVLIYTDMLVRLVDADVFVAMLSLSPGAAAVDYSLVMLPSSVFYN